MARWKQLLPGLFLIADTCNVYVVVGEKESIAIDFGSGKWLAELKKRKLPPLKRVYLTHHHVDQCQGLAGQSGFKVFASAGDEPFLSPKGVQQFWKHAIADRSLPVTAFCPAASVGSTILMPFENSLILNFGLIYVR